MERKEKPNEHEIPASTGDEQAPDAGERERLSLPKENNNHRDTVERTASAGRSRRDQNPGIRFGYQKPESRTKAFFRSLGKRAIWLGIAGIAGLITYAIPTLAFTYLFAPVLSAGALTPAVLLEIATLWVLRGVILGGTLIAGIATLGALGYALFDPD